jgi:hypothetical protein
MKHQGILFTLCLTAALSAAAGEREVVAAPQHRQNPGDRQARLRAYHATAGPLYRARENVGHERSRARHHRWREGCRGAGVLAVLPWGECAVVCEVPSNTAPAKPPDCLFALRTTRD